MDRITLNNAARLWLQYITSRQALLSAGIIRSSGDPGADFAEWLVAWALGGELVTGRNDPAYDVEAGEMRIQVKKLAKSPNNANGYTIAEKERNNDPSRGGASHYVFVFFDNFVPESMFLVPEHFVRAFPRTQIKRRDLKRGDFEVRVDWSQFQSQNEGISQGKSQMELFLKRAKEFGDKLQARRGLLPRGTAAEILREIRED